MRAIKQGDMVAITDTNQLFGLVQRVSGRGYRVLLEHGSIIDYPRQLCRPVTKEEMKRIVKIRCSEL